MITSNFFWACLTFGLTYLTETDLYFSADCFISLGQGREENSTCLILISYYMARSIWEGGEEGIEESFPE